MGILEDYNKFKNISKKKEKELFQDIDNKENRHEIIQSHLKLVSKIAKKYSFLNGNVFEDLVQEGTLGLVLAIDKFDPSLEFRFSTFASFYIRNQIRKYLRSSAYLFHIPENKIHKMFKIIKESPENMDISSLGDDVLCILLCKERYYEEINKNKIEYKMELLEVYELLNYFCEKDRLIINLRYNEGRTWREISSIVGMSHEGCRKRHDKIIFLIRKNISSF
jgi:RNA polymerase sigma factor (sigma-70 family)